MDTPPPSDASLSALLQAHGDRLPPALRRLGDALWTAQDESISHAACLAALPQFIDAELAGEPVVRRYPLVKHHLDRCDSCADEYADLLDTALAEAQGALPTLDAATGPDLSFLHAASPQQNKNTPGLNEVVLKWTRELVAILAPESLHQVNVVAKPFFQQVSAAHESLEPYLNSSRSTPLRGDQSNPAFNTLAATYVATRLLITQVPRAQFELWLGTDQVPYHVESHALAAALQLQLQADTAQAFATAYAERVTAEANLLLTLLAL